jgi:uracil-DNA glycosylase
MASDFKSQLLGCLTNAEWHAVLAPEFEKPYFNTLCETLAQRMQTEVVLPPMEHIFEAFNFTSPSAVKVVIIGQGSVILQH